MMRPLRINMLEDFDLEGKKVLIRLDLNVPMQDGVILNDARIRASYETVKRTLEQGAKVMLISHLGRPPTFDGSNQSLYRDYSLGSVAGWFQREFNMPVPLIKDWLCRPINMEPGQLAVLENVRFYSGEAENAVELAQQIADLCDIVVFEAFAVSHRANSSTEALLRTAKSVCAGPLFLKEIEAMRKIREDANRPLVTITGGAKVSDKLQLLKSLSRLSDHVIVGGAMANTFLAAEGLEIGKSLYEPDMLASARRIYQSGNIHIPRWVVVAPSLSTPDLAQVRHVTQIREMDTILDVAPRSFDLLRPYIDSASTILWNGPMGVFENVGFASGSARLSSIVSQAKAYRVAGGGDTLSAIDQFGVEDKLDFVSTGGGAFLSALEGAELPSLTALLSNGN